MTFKHHLELFFDLQSDRYIDYQITLLDPRLVLVERVISAAIFGFLVALPFYPSAKLILQGNMDTSATSWPSLLLILALSALVCSSFNVFIACFLTKTSQLSHLWPRCNEPLLMLGGFWVPWFVVWQFSPMLGKLALLNPLLYVTDGVRQAILGGDQFLSIRVASTGLLVFSLIFVALACCFFKRRVDHI
jgi:ABC-type polysaccharide/polyol phosphate export permease